MTRQGYADLLAATETLGPCPEQVVDQTEIRVQVTANRFGGSYQTVRQDHLFPH